MIIPFVIIGLVVASTVLACSYRAIFGPGTYNRIVAANVIGTKAIVILVLVGYIIERPQFIDVALMYAAIFSEKEVYECQLKRLMKRVDVLASLYKDKANFISNKGCSSNMNSELIALSGFLTSYQSSNNLDSVYDKIKVIDQKNNLNSGCKLW